MRSEAANAARANALRAVEVDPARLRDRWLDLRLAAAIALAPSLVLCEALVAGVAVPSDRLDPQLAERHHLHGNVTLTIQLAYAIAAATEPVAETRAAA